MFYQIDTGHANGSSWKFLKMSKKMFLKDRWLNFSKMEIFVAQAAPPACLDLFFVFLQIYQLEIIDFFGGLFDQQLPPHSWHFYQEASDF